MSAPAAAELCEDFDVQRIACDLDYFTRSMLRLQNEYGLPVEESARTM